MVVGFGGFDRHILAYLMLVNTAIPHTSFITVTVYILSLLLNLIALVW